jgi:hypothetical protein
LGSAQGGTVSGMLVRGGTCRLTAIEHHDGQRLIAVLNYELDEQATLTLLEP